MNDFYEKYRIYMIETMQVSLKQIRTVLDIKVQEFGDYLGLSRQSVNNLEKRSNKMSASQYLAVAALVDFKLKLNPECYDKVISVLKSNDVNPARNTFNYVEMKSLVHKWLMCFKKNESRIERLAGTFSVADIRELVGTYRIMLDDTIMLKDGGIQSIEGIVNVMLEQKERFILPVRVAESLQRKAYESNDASSQRALEALKFLKEMQIRKCLDIFGDIGDTTVINTIVSVLVGKKCSARMALLTADKVLADQVQRINALPGFPILVLDAAEDGSIKKWPLLNTDYDDIAGEGETADDIPDWLEEDDEPGWGFNAESVGLAPVDPDADETSMENFDLADVANWADLKDSTNEQDGPKEKPIVLNPNVSLGGWNEL